MNCAFDKEKLTAFYDGELDAAGKTEVERHISACSECLRDLGEIKSASLLVKELPRPRAPRSIAEGVSREIAAAGRVHSFSRARSMVLWAVAAAAGLFIVANVIFFSGGPAREAPVASGPDPSPMIGAVPAAEEEKKDAGRSDALKEAKAEAAPVATKENDRTFGQKAAAPRPEPAKEPARDGKELAEGRKLDAEAAKARVEEKQKFEPEAPRPTTAAPKPAAAPAPTPPPAPPPPAKAPASDPKQPPAERSQNLLVQQNRDEAPRVVNVSSTEIAKVRPAVEEIVRRYAERANADRNRQLQQDHGQELKKSFEGKDATARREAGGGGSLILDLTPSEYEALKKEIEQATGAQLAFAAPADGRLRGGQPPAPAAGKAGPGEAERAAAQPGAAQAGGLAKAPAAPNAEDLRRKTGADENLAKKEQQGPAGQQLPGNTQKDAPLAKDKNAQEPEPRRIQAGETRIRIVINFIEIPVAEKK